MSTPRRRTSPTAVTVDISAERRALLAALEQLGIASAPDPTTATKSALTNWLTRARREWVLLLQPGWISLPT
jgi:hypothetical protein